MRNSNIENHISDEPAKPQTERGLSTESKTLMHCRGILALVFKEYGGPVAIRLWNDETVIGNSDAVFTLVFRQAYPLKELILNRNLSRFAEAHLSGDVEGEGDLKQFFDFVEHLQSRKFGLLERIKLFKLALAINCHRDSQSLLDRNSSPKNTNSRESIAHHYDVHNDFYKLFLDPEMVYSCAYFSDENQPLAQAQRDKLDYICRKLRLAEGQKLLDIGCGWGGLAFWAARNYGVEVHGITLSQEQYDYAVSRSRELGLKEKVKFELRDYRDLDGEEQYDRIVSVGMFEHIGIANFPRYFHTVSRLLKPKGLFLNHGITNDTGWRDTPVTRFMNEFIFPDGELARVSDVTDAMENQSLEILDTEALRPHYAMTLCHWVSKLEAAKDEAIQLVGFPTYRLWVLYMIGSAYYFTQGSTGLYQILACKSRSAWPLPLRRDGLYCNVQPHNQPA